MYRDKDAQNCLFGLVGFRDSDNPQFERLSSGLLQSSTGLYFQDDCPLVSLENLDQCFKSYDKYVYPAYAPATEYEELDRVRAADNKIYESLEDGNTGNEPSVSPLFWKEVKVFSQALETMVRGSISKVLGSFATNKKLAGITKSLFENVLLYDGAGPLLDKEPKSGRFVGYQISVTNERDLTAVIKRLGTQFSAANPAFKLYVYHSSQEAPIKIFDLNLTRVNSFEWTKLLDNGQEFSLKYSGDLYAPGGLFYIGYYEDELVGQAINRGYDFGVAPTCSSCNNDYRYWSYWGSYLTIAPIAVSPAYLVDKLPGDPGGPLLWDISKNQFTYTRSYGLNLDVAVRCDITDLICSEKQLFAQAIIKQFTVDALYAIAYNTRNNAIEKVVRDMAMFELNNKDNNTPGALKKLEKALAALDFDLSDLHSDCLPCSNKYGIESAVI